MTNKICHLRCSTCKSEAIGESLGECLKNIKCLSDGGPLDETCKIALQADGKAVFVLDQKIKDSYKGETDLSGKIQEKKSSKKETPKEPTEEASNETSEETTGEFNGEDISLEEPIIE